MRKVLTLTLSENIAPIVPNRRYYQLRQPQALKSL